MQSDLDSQLLLDAVGKGTDDEATMEQATVYRHVIGQMLLIGLMSAPLMLLNSSIAVSKLADLRCHHLQVHTFKMWKCESGSPIYIRR